MKYFYLYCKYLTLEEFAIQFTSMSVLEIINKIYTRSFCGQQKFSINNLWFIFIPIIIIIIMSVGFICLIMFFIYYLFIYKFFFQSFWRNHWRLLHRSEAIIWLAVFAIAAGAPVIRVNPRLIAGCLKQHREKFTT